MPMQKHDVSPSTLKDRLSGLVVYGSKPGPELYLPAHMKNWWGSYLMQLTLTMVKLEKKFYPL